MPYPAGPAQYGVAIGATVPPAEYFVPQPGDAPVFPPEPFIGADGTVTYDGLPTLVLRWFGPHDPAFFDHLVDIWEAAQGAGGRAAVHYYRDRSAAYVNEIGVPLFPTIRARSGWWVYDIEWTIQGLGLT